MYRRKVEQRNRTKEERSRRWPTATHPPGQDQLISWGDILKFSKRVIPTAQKRPCTALPLPALGRMAGRWLLNNFYLKELSISVQLCLLRVASARGSIPRGLGCTTHDRHSRTHSNNNSQIYSLPLFYHFSERGSSFDYIFLNLHVLLSVSNFLQHPFYAFLVCHTCFHKLLLFLFLPSAISRM